MVEQLGSGIPRILEVYPKESFRFTENFLRITFPSSKIIKDNEQVTTQVKDLLKVMVSQKAKSRAELQKRLKLLNREYFRKNYLQPAIKAGYVELTVPNKPTSSKQKYFLTLKGKKLLETFSE